MSATLMEEASGALSVPRASTEASTAAGPMIRAQGLGRRFGDQWAMQDLELELERGEVFGLLGPNGAGKTTTVRMLTALIAPTTGRATVDGFDVAASPDEVRRRVGLLTETPSLYERLSAAQNLDFFGELHGVPHGVRRERAERLLRLFDLWDRRNDLAGTFSKGMKQKLAIARALLHEPSVLFLDEPTSGLDPEAAFVVREAIGRLKREGRTIVLATHDLDEAERLSDRIAFLRGTILRIDTPERLRSEAGGATVVIDLVDDPPPSLERDLKGNDATRRLSVEGLRLTVAVDDVRHDTPRIVRSLVEGGASILGVRESKATLESVYFDVFGIRPTVNGDV